MEDLSNTINQRDLTETYKTFYPAIPEYTFFTITHGTFFRIDHMLDHKISLNTFKRVKLLQTIFSNYNGVKQNINFVV